MISLRGWFAGFLSPLLLLAMLLAPLDGAAAAGKQKPAADNQAVKLPEHLGNEDVDRIVAGLSDEQVRRLLIDELKNQALQEAGRQAAKAPPTGMAGFITKIKDLTTLFQSRIDFLRAGGKDTSKEAGGIYALLGKGERGTKTVAGVIVSVAAVLAGGLLVQWLFVRYTATTRRRITSVVPSGVIAKIGALSMRALLDMAGIPILILAVVVFLFLFLDRTAGQRVLLAAYLTALVCVQVVYLASRFFLAPREPVLRFLPLGDETALYLHRWLLALAFVITFSNVTSGVISLAGATELTRIKSGTVGGLIAAGMIIWMILQRRKAAATVLSRGLPEFSLRYRLAQKWHHFAVFGVLLLLVSSVFSAVLGTSSGQAILTLLMVALYFMLDWLLRSMLEAAFGLVEQRPHEEQPAPVSGSAESAQEGAETEAALQAAGGASADQPATGGRLDLERMKGPLLAALRLSLAVLMVLWILDIWHIDLPIGEAVVGTLVKILIVVLVCYIGYGLANAAIMRRLSQETTAAGDSEEMEEGGAGGSRIGTLLMLLRKFLLVVIIVMAVLIILSALGVNIGPLIAGAGVFGLAIGFGAQTLVKDIISGMFFLIDDAIRVGDYVECGGAKGMVEQISLRSLRLRHPRGQVYILPFGDIKNVTNLSRDYVIMKLDFRVRYDADVEMIRKIIKKKVYQPIADNPELGPKLLEPIKSQGVREMDDSAMIMRVKYKTKPGDQFMVRKEVYRLMQEAFKEAGIEFAHRNVTVYIPPEVQQTVSKADDQTRTKMLTGAAAALAAEEEKQRKQGEPPQ